MGKILRIILIVAIAMGISWFVADKVLGLYWIPSSSMSPTLEVGDRVLVNKLYPTYYSVKTGDIIVFTDPGKWLTDTEKVSGNTLIKRVVAMGGDTIECCSSEGNLVVNGVTVYEPYIDPADMPSESSFKELVPDGYVYVMGDNRSDSNDSRYQTETSGGKFIPMTSILGVAIYDFSTKENRWIKVY